MSTTTMGLGARVLGVAETIGEGTRNVFGRMLERAIAVREVEARRRMETYLHYVSDKQLVELGMSAQDIQLMRDTGRVPPTFWS